jgi:hypothetical protein
MLASFVVGGFADDPFFRAAAPIFLSVIFQKWLLRSSPVNLLSGVVDISVLSGNCRRPFLIG